MTVEEFKSYYNNCLLFGTTNEDGTVEIGDMLCEPCKSGARIVGVVKGRNPSHIELDECITEIGEYAFGTNGDSEPISVEGYFVESVYGPNVRVIRRYAFAHCVKLTRIRFPRVAAIDKCAFFGCKLERVTLPEVKDVCEYAFAHNTHLRRINLLKCKIIGPYSFVNCHVLEIVNLPLLEFCGNHAFATCDSLKEVTLPSLIGIGHYAFSECYLLRTLKLPSMLFYAKFHTTDIVDYRTKKIDGREMILATFTIIQDCISLQTLSVGAIAGDCLDIYKLKEKDLDIVADRSILLTEEDIIENRYFLL